MHDYNSRGIYIELKFMANGMRIAEPGKNAISVVSFLIQIGLSKNTGSIFIALLVTVYSSSVEKIAGWIEFA